MTCFLNQLGGSQRVIFTNVTYGFQFCPRYAQKVSHVARSLGANAWQRFRYVILPLIIPGVLSASMLVLAFTFGAFEIPYLLGQRFPSALPVLSFRAYTDVDLNARPEAMAMSMIIAGLITILVYVYQRVTRAGVRDE